MIRKLLDCPKCGHDWPGLKLPTQITATILTDKTMSITRNCSACGSRITDHLSYKVEEIVIHKDPLEEICEQLKLARKTSNELLDGLLACIKGGDTDDS